MEAEQTVSLGSSSLTLVRLGDPSDSVRDVSKDDKGRIFQDTFVRGVKVIWIFDGGRSPRDIMPFLANTWVR